MNHNLFKALKRIATSMANDVEIVPTAAIIKAITPTVKKVLKKYKVTTPEYHIEGGDILPTKYDERGIEWGGDYGEWNEKSLGSKVQKGDIVSLDFRWSEDSGKAPDTFAFTIYLDTSTMTVKLKDDYGNPIKL